MTENETGFIRPVKKPEENPLSNMPALFDVALSEFSSKPFDSASLNDIIKACQLSKGSFYHRFADKLDLYLCVIDIISKQKTNFFLQKYGSNDIPQDFFGQIRFIVRQGIEFALQEPRYYAFWRMHLAESLEIKNAVAAAFPARGRDDFDSLIRKAIDEGQFSPAYSFDFIKDILTLFIYHIDTLIQPDMTEKDILRLIDNLTDMLKNGLKSSD